MLLQSEKLRRKRKEKYHLETADLPVYLCPPGTLPRDLYRDRVIPGACSRFIAECRRDVCEYL